MKKFKVVSYWDEDSVRDYRSELPVSNIVWGYENALKFAAVKSCYDYDTVGVHKSDGKGIILASYHRGRNSGGKIDPRFHYLKDSERLKAIEQKKHIYGACKKCDYRHKSLMDVDARLLPTAIEICYSNPELIKEFDLNTFNIYLGCPLGKIKGQVQV